MALWAPFCMAEPVITCAIAEGLATLTLARADAGNAIGERFIADFAAAADQVARDGTVRAVLIEAQGKNFCVGGDIHEFAAHPLPERFVAQVADRLHEGILALMEQPAPVVIAVQGAAAGAGLSLVASGDVVIGARSSLYAMAYSSIGLTADGGASWLLPRLIGLRRTQQLAYLGTRLGAEEALDWGLLTQVIDDADLADQARAVARRLAAGPTRAFGQIKRLLADGQTATLAVHLHSEAASMGEAMASDDAQGAIRAFLARETPVFTGR